MKVILAEKAGFCMGVRRAVDMTLNLVETQCGSSISTFGPLIHNPQVLEFLENKGVAVINDIPKNGTGKVIIRAHGVPPGSKTRLENAGLTVNDATCPRVVKVQVIIERHAKEGKTIVIVGDRNHAEVEGLCGYARGDFYVVSTETEAKSLVLSSPYIIVSQTTQDEVFFANIVDLIKTNNPNGQVFNTICDSTHKRQDEVRTLCKQVDALVVVGGRNSANTTRLGIVAQGEGTEVFVIETKEELNLEILATYKIVGVTAGASTPNWIIKEVVKTLEAL